MTTTIFPCLCHEALVFGHVPQSHILIRVAPGPAASSHRAESSPVSTWHVLTCIKHVAALFSPPKAIGIPFNMIETQNGFLRLAHSHCTPGDEHAQSLEEAMKTLTELAEVRTAGERPLLHG